MSGIDRSTVEKTAWLARIALTDEEIARFTKQLGQVLTHMERLRSVDTEHVPPTASILPVTDVMREDEVRPSLSVEDVLRDAPDRDGDLFRVQTPLEERG